MNDFGPHDGLVREVIDFVLGGGVLVSPFTPPASEGDYLIIRSLDEIDIELYWEPHIDGARIVGNRNWTDIKRVDGERFKLDYLPKKQVMEVKRLRDRLWPSYEAASREMYQILASRLTGVLPESEIGEISGDFDHFVFVRSLRGRLADSFTERLFSVYRMGGYPCGWDGEFPAGRLVVFSR